MKTFCRPVQGVFMRKEQQTSDTRLAGAQDVVIPAAKLSAQSNPGASKSTREGTQTMFGMEIETRIPIDVEGKSIKGCPRIASHKNGLYHIDVDHHDNISILEFVMDAFDEHAGTLNDAHAELNRRLTAIETLITATNNAAKGTLADTLFEEHDVGMEKYDDVAQLNNLAMDNAVRLSGPIHFTIGFAPQVMDRLIRERLTDDNYAKTGDSKQRATEARALTGMGGFPAIANTVDRDRLTGYLELMYLQIAAAMDGVHDQTEGRGRLTKNRTQAMCRVPFSVIYDELPQAEQNWLKTNQDAVLKIMQERFSGQAGTWKIRKKDEKAHPKDKILIPAPAQRLVKAGFGQGVNDKPEDIYGDMTVIYKGERVGPVNGTLRGYALELRRQVVTDANPANRKQVAEGLITYSRLVHGT